MTFDEFTEKLKKLPTEYNLAFFSDEYDKQLIETDMDLHGIGINDFIYAVGTMIETDSYYTEEILWNELLCGYNYEQPEDVLDRLYTKYTKILNDNDRRLYSE